MFKDEILEMIFANKEMQKIPIGCQSTAVSVFEDVLEELRKENPYATISAEFTTTFGNDTDVWSKSNVGTWQNG